ncbi:MAG TPA: alpha-hydroxy acid oxidase [Bryobacteraceae bacterium]|nr:alpha-hydroxy acid oxidase [Bryobacteraceae bacterium]
MPNQVVASRRQLLRHLLASPLIGGFTRLASADELIGNPAEAINIFDLAAAAEKRMSAAHWAYLATGVEDNNTVKANREGFQLFQIRSRRFVAVERIDTTVELFGRRYPSPVILAPIGSQRAFHAEGELAVARAARVKAHQMILSTVTSHHVRDVARAYDHPLWFQLYPSSDWTVAKHLITRAEEAGCSALVLTADTPAHPVRELVARFGRDRNAQCTGCHKPGAQSFRERPMYQGVNASRATAPGAPYTWELIQRIRDLSRLKLIVKGVMTAEDAQLCTERGIDGIIVSNHGGRQEESNLSTIEALPEIVAAVKGRIPVLIDGGFRRGSDIFKAIGLGAAAICIGRPYIWGLGAFGQPGVERVLELLEAELGMTMKMAGTPSLAAITPSFVRRRP